MPLEEPVQRYVLERMQEALGERSWNWLAEASGVKQSTLAGQLGPVQSDPRAIPRFSIATIVAVARALRRPVAWFFPGFPDADEEARIYREAEAYRRVRAVVEDEERHR